MAGTIVSCLKLGLAAAVATGCAARLSADPTLTFAAGAALGGVAGNFATELFKILNRTAVEPFLRCASGIDENHQVAAALRQAHLQSLRIVLRRFDAIWPNDPDTGRKEASILFSTRLHHFIDTESRRAGLPGFKDTSYTFSQESELRDAVIRALPDVFDSALAARRATGEGAAFVESLAQLRDALDEAVLAEIQLNTQFSAAEIPTAFSASFSGSGFLDSWVDLFVRDAAFHLKEDPALARIWEAEQLAFAKSISEANHTLLVSIELATSQIKQDVREIVDSLAKGRSFRAAAKHAGEDPSRSFLEGKPHVLKADLAEVLTASSVAALGDLIANYEHREKTTTVLSGLINMGTPEENHRIHEMLAAVVLDCGSRTDLRGTASICANALAKIDGWKPSIITAKHLEQYATRGLYRRDHEHIATLSSLGFALAKVGINAPIFKSVDLLIGDPDWGDLDYDNTVFYYGDVSSQIVSIERHFGELRRKGLMLASDAHRLVRLVERVDGPLRNRVVFRLRQTAYVLSSHGHEEHSRYLMEAARAA